MEKTLSININGWVFNINEDAYHLLSEYFENITKYFSKEEGGAEIVSDIEARVAELLKEKINESETAVNIQQIQEIMEIMGQPYEMEADADDSIGEGSKRTNFGSRKLFRDTDNSHIAGVAAGLGTYFKLDPIFIRIAFLLLIFTGGVGVILYIALWILIPEAASISDKIRMEGKKVDIKNIEDKVKEEAAYLSDRLSEFSTEAKDAYHKTRPVRKKGIKKAEEMIKSTGRIILRLLKFLLGFILFLTGVGLLIPFVIFFFNWVPGLEFETFTVHGISLPQFLSTYLFDTKHPLILLSTLTITILIPVIMLIFNGIRFLFNFKRKKLVGAIAVQIWLAAFIITLGFSYTTLTAFKADAVNITHYDFDEMNSDTLYIKLNKQSYFQDVLTGDHKTVLSQDENFPILHKGEFYGVPRFRIRLSDNDNFKLKIFYSASGHKDEDAHRNIQMTEYVFDIDSSTLVLDPYFKLQPSQKWRDQEVKIELFVPSQRYISIETSIPKYLKMNYKWRRRLEHQKAKASYWYLEDDRFVEASEMMMAADSVAVE